MRGVSSRRTMFDYSKSSRLQDQLYEYMEALRLLRATPRDRILDVGCGLNPLRRAGWNVVGVDVAENSLADFRGDARSLPFPDKSFDYAVSVEVIEHLDAGGGEALVAELARVARRGFAVSTANRWTGPHDGRHVHEYSLPELLSLVRRYGRVTGVGYGGVGGGLVSKAVRRFGVLSYLLPWPLWCEWFCVVAEPW